MVVNISNANMEQRETSNHMQQHCTAFHICLAVKGATAADPFSSNQALCACMNSNTTSAGAGVPPIRSNISDSSNNSIQKGGQWPILSNFSKQQLHVSNNMQQQASATSRVRQTLGSSEEQSCPRHHVATVDHVGGMNSNTFSSRGMSKQRQCLAFEQQAKTQHRQSGQDRGQLCTWRG